MDFVEVEKMELEEILQSIAEEQAKIEAAEAEEEKLKAQIARIQREQKMQSRKFQNMRTHKFCVFAGAFWAEFRKLTATNDEQYMDILSRSDKDMESFARSICKTALQNSDQ